MDEPEFKRVGLVWRTSFEMGINPRTLQRWLGMGFVEMERREGKRYWRRKDEKFQALKTARVSRREIDKLRVAELRAYRTQDHGVQP